LFSLGVIASLTIERPILYCQCARRDFQIILSETAESIARAFGDSQNVPLPPSVAGNRRNECRDTTTRCASAFVAEVATRPCHGVPVRECTLRSTAPGNRPTRIARYQAGSSR